MGSLFNYDFCHDFIVVNCPPIKRNVSDSSIPGIFSQSVVCVSLMKYEEAWIPFWMYCKNGRWKNGDKKYRNHIFEEPSG